MSKTKPAVQTYDILDAGMRYVGANRLRPGQKTITCTEAEAKFFVEGGGLRLTDPAETAKEIKAATPIPPAQEPERPEAASIPVAGDAASVVEEPARAPTRKGSR